MFPLRLMAEASILPKAVARSVRKLTYVGSLWVSRKTSHDQSNSEVLHLPARSATGRTRACRAQATWNSVSRLSEFPSVLLHRCLIWQPLNDITCQELQRGRSGTYEILWMELPRCETINQLCEALLSLKDERLRHSRGMADFGFSLASFKAMLNRMNWDPCILARMQTGEI